MSVGQLKQKWALLRLFRRRGSVLIDYRILKNSIRITGRAN
ncbi:YlcG family protein [Mangrovibacter phragmitis]